MDDQTIKDETDAVRSEHPIAGGDSEGQQSPEPAVQQNPQPDTGEIGAAEPQAEDLPGEDDPMPEVESA